MSEHRCGRTGPQGVAVVDAVAAGEDGVDHRHGLVADVRPARCGAQINMGVEQLPQSETLGKGGRGDQPGVGHQAYVVEDHPDPVQSVRGCTHRKGASGLGQVAASQSLSSQARAPFLRMAKPDRS
jgi:hypothetical protein